MTFTEWIGFALIFWALGIFVGHAAGYGRGIRAERARRNRELSQTLPTLR